MPIVKIENSVEIQLGTGDISVMPGLLDQETIVGVVCFAQKSYTPIGTIQHHDPFISREVEETPVRLTFSKVESIDVLIRSLESAKRYMVNGKLDYDHKKECAVDTAQPTAASAIPKFSGEGCYMFGLSPNEDGEIECVARIEDNMIRFKITEIDLKRMLRSIHLWKARQLETAQGEDVDGSD